MVDIERPPALDGGIAEVSDNLVLTDAELSIMDDIIVFQLGEQDDSPGVLLKKDDNCTWTPISSRTRSS